MSFNQETILLVEDNPMDVLLVKRAIRKVEITNPLQIVNDGDAAVFYLAGQTPYSDRDQYPLPGLILLDLKLPRRSGIEVLAWLREQPVLKRLPVVVLSTSETNSDINQAYDLGANAYMVKPIAFDDLVDMIKTLNLHWITLNKKPQVEIA